MEIERSVESDLGELFSLQRAAFVDEAMIYGTPHVPALDETFADFAARHGESETFVARDGTRIVGAVSIRRYEEAPDVERLMTVPDQRGRGIGSALLRHAEQTVAAEGHSAIQLIVGELAIDNRRLYERLGYQEISSFAPKEFPDVTLLRMTKHLP